MKIKLSYYLPLAILFATGCTKHSVAPLIIPTGNFSGQFILIHLSSKTGLLDTVRSNVVLSMSATAGYALTSDTTTIQAPSNGPFALADANYITFSDKTAAGGVKTVGQSPKIHLNGTYSFYYDGHNFNFYTTSADTLGYNYVLTKN